MFNMVYDFLKINVKFEIKKFYSTILLDYLNMNKTHIIVKYIGYNMLVIGIMYQSKRRDNYCIDKYLMYLIIF